ncbi:uncharacterized protein [Centruroides vittatus]|uniref:uncharacterized protein n=1 Tax=Centruroides vittatus TaxID=120091 RepID=UPI00350F9D64
MTVDQSEVSQGKHTLRATPPPKPLEPESKSELEESELESEICEAETTGEQEIMPPYALRSRGPVEDQPNDYRETGVLSILTVPVVCLVASTIILPLLGDGPHWDDLLKDVYEIVENWPEYVFHYNNFIALNAGNSIRHQHLWFLSALFQQILVAIPLLYINNRWPKYGKIITVMLIMAGVVSHIINTNVYKDHAMFGYSTDLRKLLNYYNHNYSKPYYTHLSSFFTGFLFGCFLLEKKEIKYSRPNVCN